MEQVNHNDLVTILQKMEEFKQKKSERKCKCKTIFIVDEHQLDAYSLSLQLQYLKFESKCVKKTEILKECQ